MSVFELYLYLVLVPGISEVAVVLATVGLILSAVGGLLWSAFTLGEGMTGEKEWMEGSKKIAGRIFKVMTVVLLVSVSVPDEKQIAKIIGGYVVTNIEGVAALPENLVKYANEFLNTEAEGDE